MTLLVRDEADVVAAMIEHHLAAGVDLIVATDNGSVDGTVEILRAYRDAGVLELHHEPAQDYEQGRWVTRMARRAAAEHGADWVINADADEFFWPASGSLKDVLGAVDPAFGVVEMRRDNLVAAAVDGGWVQRLIVRDTASLSPRGTRIGPKTCHRADPEVTVEQGNHGVSGPRLGPMTTAGLDILHVPDRGYDQYERKIANGGAAYSANTRLDPGVGWHWREDYERLRDGTLHQAYLDRQPDVAAGLASGVLVGDTRLRDRLTALDPVVPWALHAVTRSPAGSK